MFAKKSLFALGLIVTFVSFTQASQDPWNCQELEASTDSYYRMFPSYLGRAMASDSDSHKLGDLVGHCFTDITIYSTFKYLDEENTHL